MEELNHIKKHAAGIRLTEAERSRIRQNLFEYMQANPARVVSPLWGVRSPFSYLLQPGAFALMLIIFVGVGTAGAAEGALPGDLLYPIKVSINEPVAGAFQISDEAQASWQVSLADRRLAEVDELVIDDTFSDVRVAALVAEATAKAAEKVDEYSKKDSQKAAKAAARLEQVLASREGALRSLSGKGTASSTPVLRAAADTARASAKARTESQRGKSVAAPEMAAFSLEMGGAGDASVPDDDGDDEEFDKKEYDRAAKLFERTRELAKEDRERQEHESEDSQNDD